MTRYFRIEEAQRLVPQVERLIRQALELKADYDRAEASLRAFNHRLAVAGGMIPDRAQLLADRTARDTAAQRLNETIEAIHETGCQVKDLDIGLLDFPTLYRGEEVCLCWKLGEQAIGFWHSATEGFKGRKPIDEEFMANHRGSRPA
ncbi:MAG: DUF2203 domain-containing protein [Bryobacterales bacterium]|nr:DUF2203 domain-containing protein [Bryobacterales bacterium]